MTKPRIQRMKDFEAEMRAVARGEKRAPADAHRTVPTAIAGKFRIVIDPYSMKDRVEAA